VILHKKNESKGRIKFLYTKLCSPEKQLWIFVNYACS